ncbi:MAG: outer membrane beta-barrel protein [Thermodesulfovibrionales bacterium]|nr:outer membrane beta-barrel protein [Thermodesulfovibrionales bacterium]
MAQSIILLMVFLLFPSTVLYSADLFAIRTADATDQEIVMERKDAPPGNTLKQMGAFQIRKNAERLAEKLERDGMEPVVLAVVTNENQTIYKVYIRKQGGATHKDKLPRKFAENIVAEEAQDSLPPETPRQLAQDRAVQEEDLLLVLRNFSSKAEGEEFSGNMEKAGYLVMMREVPTGNGQPIYVVSAEKPQVQSGSTVLSGEIDKTSQPVITTKAEPPPPSPDIIRETPGKAVPEELPVGTPKERVSKDVLGKRGGFVHPFLSITEYYIDNVFYSNDRKDDDFITVLSPGIWLAVPHVYEKLLRVETSDISPGGFSLSRYKPEEFKRYQAYLFYNADIEKFAKHSSEDAVNHKFEGFFQYNLRGGLSFEVMDQYIDSHDDRGSGIYAELDKFRTNLANFIVKYAISERLELRVDSSYFLVNYAKARNNYRDRHDWSLSAYTFYKATPKMRFFIEYEYIDITYDKNIVSDSQEHHYFGGIQWDITAKSKGSIKAGYGTKDFASATETSNDFIFEAQIDHHFTPKTSLILKASRRTTETDISTTDFVVSDTIELEYLQRITAKVTADIKLSYTRDAYKDEFTYGGRTAPLDDDYYYGAFALQYKFREWLFADAGYIFMKRDSSFSDFDYTTNVMFVRITGSL